MNRKSLERAIVESCREDYTGLWEIIGMVEMSLLSGSIRTLTLRVIHGLLSKHAIQAGDLVKGDSGFIPWEGTPEDIVRKIDREWQALDRNPIIGEIAWFDVTGGSGRKDGEEEGRY